MNRNDMSEPQDDCMPHQPNSVFNHAADRHPCKPHRRTLEKYMSMPILSLPQPHPRPPKIARAQTLSVVCCVVAACDNGVVYAGHMIAYHDVAEKAPCDFSICHSNRIDIENNSRSVETGFAGRNIGDACYRMNSEADGDYCNRSGVDGGYIGRNHADSCNSECRPMVPPACDSPQAQRYAGPLQTRGAAIEESETRTSQSRHHAPTADVATAAVDASTIALAANPELENSTASQLELPRIGATYVSPPSTYASASASAPMRTAAAQNASAPLTAAQNPSAPRETGALACSNVTVHSSTLPPSCRKIDRQFSWTMDTFGSNRDAPVTHAASPPTLSAAPLFAQAFRSDIAAPATRAAHESSSMMPGIALLPSVPTRARFPIYSQCDGTPDATPPHSPLCTSSATPTSNMIALTPKATTSSPMNFAESAISMSTMSTTSGRNDDSLDSYGANDSCTSMATSSARSTAYDAAYSSNTQGGMSATSYDTHTAPQQQKQYTPSTATSAIENDVIIQSILSRRSVMTDVPPEAERERQIRMYAMIRHSHHYRRMQVAMANNRWTDNVMADDAANAMPETCTLDAQLQQEQQQQASLVPDAMMGSFGSSHTRNHYDDGNAFSKSGLLDIPDSLLADIAAEANTTTNTTTTGFFDHAVPVDDMSSCGESITHASPVRQVSFAEHPTSIKHSSEAASMRMRTQPRRRVSFSNSVMFFVENNGMSGFNVPSSNTNGIVCSKDECVPNVGKENSGVDRHAVQGSGATNTADSNTSSSSWSVCTASMALSSITATTVNASDYPSSPATSSDENPIPQRRSMTKLTLPTPTQVMPIPAHGHQYLRHHRHLHRHHTATTTTQAPHTTSPYRMLRDQMLKITTAGLIARPSAYTVSSPSSSSSSLATESILSQRNAAEPESAGSNDTVSSFRSHATGMPTTTTLRGHDNHVDGGSKASTISLKRIRGLHKSTHVDPAMQCSDSDDTQNDSTVAHLPDVTCMDHVTPSSPTSDMVPTYDDTSKHMSSNPIHSMFTDLHSHRLGYGRHKHHTHIDTSTDVVKPTTSTKSSTSSSSWKRLGKILSWKQSVIAS